MPQNSKPKEVSSISQKKYEIIVPKQEKTTEIQLEKNIENAILLTLLEQKYITIWQYEGCCEKLRLPITTNTMNNNPLKR